MTVLEKKCIGQEKRWSRKVGCELRSKHVHAATHFFCEATKEVRQNFARVRTTVTREIRAVLRAAQRRARRAPAYVPLHTSPIELSSPAPGTSARPTACRVGSASQPPSFGFLPSLRFRSTPPWALHDPATPSRKPFHTLCGVEPGPHAKPRAQKCSNLRTKSRRLKNYHPR